jgi:hypothetical protein
MRTIAIARPAERRLNEEGPQMPGSEDFRAKAQQYLQMAAEVTDPLAVMLLRMAAEDYLERAEKAGQQQQQIQPKKPKEQ